MCTPATTTNENHHHHQPRQPHREVSNLTNVNKLQIIEVHVRITRTYINRYKFKTHLLNKSVPVGSEKVNTERDFLSRSYIIEYKLQREGLIIEVVRAEQ